MICTIRPPSIAILALALMMTKVEMEEGRRSFPPAGKRFSHRLLFWCNYRSPTRAVRTFSAVIGYWDANRRVGWRRPPTDRRPSPNWGPTFLLWGDWGHLSTYPSYPFPFFLKKKKIHLTRTFQNLGRELRYMISLSFFIPIQFNHLLSNFFLF